MDARTREIALTRKNQFAAHRFDFNAVRNAVQIADDFLEIRRGEVDDRRVFHVGHHQFLRVGLNQPQFLTIALFDVAVVVLEPQMRHNAVVVIALFDIHRQRVVVGHGTNHLEQMERVGTHDDFVRMTHVLLEFVRAQHHVYQDGVGFVEIDDFEPAFGEGHRCVRQNVFDSRYHVADWLNLDGFDGQYIVRLVHIYRCCVCIGI